MTLRSTATVQPEDQRWAGCPDVLEVDLPEHDVGVTSTDWLQGPPTADRHRRAGAEDADVTSLTATRATRLLDATIAHVHTAMEATGSTDTRHKLDRAVADLARARDALIEVGDTHGGD